MRENAVEAGAKRWRVIIVIACVAAISAVAYWNQINKATLKEKDATIVSLDPAARTARIRIIHPKTGEAFELAGDVPSECEIFIDGRPAQMSELTPGETVRVKG